MKPVFKILCVLSCILISGQAYAQISLFKENRTPTYYEVIEAYKSLDESYDQATLLTVGNTDAGKPLHVFVMATDPVRAFSEIEKKTNGKTVVLINNGIHPGEPCGIDASLLFAQALLENKKLSEDVVYAVIPVYNIGGALNRGRPSRANQNGPEAYGFRGNAQNLDLNRDFIKADAQNTFAFYKVFQSFKPHIFIDTHASNGADYQPFITLISTQKDKLNPALAEVLEQDLEPYLYKSMAQSGWEMVPYVNVFGRTPDAGYAAFLDLPRYASGYTALFNTIGFITETHMWKPYEERVLSTLAFLNNMDGYLLKNGEQLRQARVKAFEIDKEQVQFDVNWELDSSSTKMLNFKGYKAEYPISEISGEPRLKYNRKKKWEKEIPYYHTYTPTNSVKSPRYYVLPQSWVKVVERLEANGIELKPLLKDTVLSVSSTYITSVKFPPMPYEGHFLIKDLQTEEIEQNRQFFKGDYLIDVQQINKRFLVNVLEPEAADSYLRWNFFDAIFQQKEWFSAYVFEDMAVEILKEKPDLKIQFDVWKKELDYEPTAFEQLYFIYKKSDYYEPEHMRYPVAKMY